jgi:hypothetical protein
VKRRRASIVIRSGVVVLAALVALVAWVPTVSAQQMTVAVSRTAVTPPRADDFLGLALEYNTIPKWVPSSGPVDQPLLGLVRGLQPVGRPLIRVGGQSTDRSWWPVPGLAQPRGVTYILDRGWAARARTLAKALDARLMLGLNLEANRTRIPAQEARELVGAIGARYVQSLQIGNEPELYTFTPWYRIIHGKPAPWYDTTGERILSRAPGYDAADFVAEFARMISGLPASTPLAGPETGNPEWMQTFLRLLSPTSRVRMLTFHGYGTSGCNHDPSNPDFPSIAHMLSETASRDLIDGFTPFVGAAHHDGATIRLDELGSVTCNGATGVSDTMASALWATDSLFAVDRAGIDGVNLHSYPDSVNGLFDVTEHDGRWTAAVHPIYYGALMFARAAPAGSRVLRLSGGSDTVRPWATIGADGQVRVLLINDGSAQATVSVRAPAGYGARPAGLERLSAPSVAAKTGIALGGRQFGTTATGTLADPVAETIAPRGGAYAVRVPAASAALIVLAKPGSAAATISVAGAAAHHASGATWPIAAVVIVLVIAAAAVAVRSRRSARRRARRAREPRRAGSEG